MRDTTHKLAVCSQSGAGHYHFRNWSFDFVCPVCQRKIRASLNYLGQRKVFCDGRRSYKLGDTWGEVKKAGLDIRDCIAALADYRTKRGEMS